MKTIIAGNWKMNLVKEDVVNYINELNQVEINQDKEVIIFAPSIFLESAKAQLTNELASMGAENVHQEAKGAFTGEISAEMVKSIGIEHSLIGHSERREYYNETDQIVNKKLMQSLENSIRPMLCVGETLTERQGNLTNEILNSQIKAAFQDISAEQMANITIAYEPIWAIGTGEVATKEQAQEACAYVRSVVADLYGNDIANNMPILYGGSVNLNNFNDIVEQNDINGVLVGGASLDINSFKNMMK